MRCSMKKIDYSSDLQSSYVSEQVDRFDSTELNGMNLIHRLEITRPRRLRRLPRTS